MRTADRLLMVAYFASEYGPTCHVVLLWAARRCVKAVWVLQDVDRIETQGPRLEDLVHTHVVEESDVEEGTEANKVNFGLEPVVEGDIAQAIGLGTAP